MHRSLILGLVVPLLGSLGACGLRGGGGPAPAGAAAPSWSALPSTALVYYDNSGGIQDSLRLVIRDADALQQIWRQATAAQASPPPVPAVDFEREMVLVLGAGRMTPEDMIRADSISVRDERLAGSPPRRVMEVIVHTVEGCQSFPSDAYPLAILRVQRFNGDVRFTERRGRAEGCTRAAAPGRFPSSGRSAR